jgi:hypothetical protein
MNAPTQPPPTTALTSAFAPPPARDGIAEAGKAWGAEFARYGPLLTRLEIDPDPLLALMGQHFVTMMSGIVELASDADGSTVMKMLEDDQHAYADSVASQREEFDRVYTRVQLAERVLNERGLRGEQKVKSREGLFELAYEYTKFLDLYRGLENTLQQVVRRGRRHRVFVEFLNAVVALALSFLFGWMAGEACHWLQAAGAPIPTALCNTVWVVTTIALFAIERKFVGPPIERWLAAQAKPAIEEACRQYYFGRTHAAFELAIVDELVKVNRARLLWARLII